MTKITELTKVHLQIASPSGDGMNLELCAEADNPRFSDGSLNPVMWFRSDQEGELKFVASTKHGPVSIPLKDLENAIAVAKKEVHSESYYDDT